MNKTKLSWTVANIEKMHDEKKVLSFDHPIQRKSEQWSDTQKSLLIHSMLANYPVPNIYVLREDSQELDEKNKPVFNYFVMDGKQRLTSVLSYIWGEFPLDENIPAITIEDVEYQIAGKYFCDLEEPVQYEIKRYKFDIIAFEECSNREIEEIFFRLNNSTPLTKSQVAKAKVGVEIAEFINELLTSKFFTTSCNFSKAQLKASDDQKVLIQSMMLLDTNNVPDFELKDFSENSILEYSESIRGTYTDKQSNILKSAIQYLTDAFPEKNKQLRKISIPTLVYMADIAEDKEIKPMYFRQWFEFFTEEDELMEDYKTFCSTGSTKLEKVQGRLAVMTKSFCKYHEIEIPEELKDMVADVEEKLAAKKASEEMLTDDVMENPSEEMQGNPEDEMPVEDFPGNTEERNLDVDKEETSDPSECNSDGSENSPENNSLHDAV
ncbi:MAG: DUF262 domain-containing protein [Lachnospiraceae bacterium]|nr:DUF262 domain-containing protein [Lachnospiraceae bacterium]